MGGLFSRALLEKEVFPKIKTFAVKEFRYAPQFKSPLPLRIGMRLCTWSGFGTLLKSFTSKFLNFREQVSDHRSRTSPLDRETEGREYWRYCGGTHVVHLLRSWLPEASVTSSPCGGCTSPFNAVPTRTTVCTLSRRRLGRTAGDRRGLRK